MLKELQNISLYTTIHLDYLCEGVREFLQIYRPYIKSVKVTDVLKPEFFGNLITDKAPWLMDFSALNKLGIDFLKKNAQELPSVLLLLRDEEEISQVSQFDLPYNFSLIYMPIRVAAMELSIVQVLKKAGEIHDKKVQQARYKNLFRNSSQAKILVDPDNGKIIDANQSAAELYGIEVNELIGKGMEIIHPDKIQSIHEEMQQVTKGNNAFLNIRYTPQNREVCELEYFISSADTGGKKIVYFDIQDITEREKADQMFYQQHEMLRSTLESIDDLFFTLNRDGDFVEYYQPSGSNHFAVSSDVFVGKNIYDVGFPLDVAKKYLQTIEQVIEEDKSEQIDYYLEAFGSRLWYSARVSPRKNAFGVAEGVTVLCRDITRQKKTEETLKRARDFYLTLLADFPSMIWKTNASKRTDYFNKTWLEFTGNDLEAELKTDWIEKLHIADVSVFLSHLLNAYNKKEAFILEHRLKHHSGEYRWVINAVRPFYNLEGQFTGFIGSCYDITERRNAEEMLNLQKSAMESALEGILIVEDDNNRYPVTYGNKELASIAGKSQEEIRAADFLDVIGHPQCGNTRSKIIDALKNKKSFKGEFQIKMGDEKPWRLLYMAPVNNQKNGSGYFVAVVSDITESKSVENTLRLKNRQLQKTNEELDRFVYSTSHELRSPLMSVLGLINLLESESDVKEQGTYLEMIRDTISRLDKIIHDIIDYSRNSRMDVVFENIDFKQYIYEAIQNNSYLQWFDKINFDIDVKNGVPFFSDRKRIAIIFNNFISNSLRFHNLNQSKPTVTVKVKTSPVNTLITISDNGNGIEEKHLPRIYEMFYRGTEKSTGSGIGLYIVKEIVDKLNGNIQVNSVVGKGTTFTIDLPNYHQKSPRLISFSDTEFSESEI